MGKTVNLTTYSVRSNLFDVELYRGMAGVNGLLYGTLNSSFYNIETQWRSILVNVKDNVSISIHASVTSLQNNSLYIYNYYNNIPYNPFRNNSLFHTTVSFNLTAPSYVFRLNNSSVSQATTVSSNCISNSQTVATPAATLYPCNGPAPTSYEL